MNRLMLTLLTLCTAGFTLTGSTNAETWTDNTGKFQIEAEFSGVNGKNVVLKKPDGTTIEVPINRLSAASHARAKELYTASKGGVSASPTPPATGMPKPPEASANPNVKFKVPVAPRRCTASRFP